MVCCHLGGIVGVVIHGVVVEHGWGTDMGEGEEVEKEKEENQMQLTLDV